MRPDLMEKLAALSPKFLRFPGGNFLEGSTIATRFDWKKTIGPVEQRPGHPDDAWGYWFTDGLGLLEYLQWCEDLCMMPLLCVFAGYALRGEYVTGDALAPFVQDALDEIEYITGDTSTTWGALRAEHGHPKPFQLKYVEIGNEDWFDRSGSYDARYTAFHDAIKAKYPDLKLIATTTVTSRTPDLIDEHYYPPPPPSSRPPTSTTPATAPPPRSSSENGPPRRASPPPTSTPRSATPPGWSASSATPTRCSWSRTHHCSPT